MRDDAVDRAFANQGEGGSGNGRRVDLPGLETDADYTGNHEEDGHPPALGNGADEGAGCPRLGSGDFAVGAQDDFDDAAGKQPDADAFRKPVGLNSGLFDAELVPGLLFIRPRQGLNGQRTATRPRSAATRRARSCRRSP